MDKHEFIEKRRKRDRRRSGHRRAVVNRYKRMKGCSICGYNLNGLALEFHHRNPNEKERTVASLMHHSWKMIKAEIKKCDITCANCHAIHTFTKRPS